MTRRKGFGGFLVQLQTKIPRDCTGLPSWAISSECSAVKKQVRISKLLNVNPDTSLPVKKEASQYSCIMCSFGVRISKDLKATFNLCCVQDSYSSSSCKMASSVSQTHLWHMLIGRNDSSLCFTVTSFLNHSSCQSLKNWFIDSVLAVYSSFLS